MPKFPEIDRRNAKTNEISRRDHRKLMKQDKKQRDKTKPVDQHPSITTNQNRLKIHRG
jgi:hypothetical protein